MDKLRPRSDDHKREMYNIKNLQQHTLPRTLSASSLAAAATAAGSLSPVLKSMYHRDKNIDVAYYWQAEHLYDKSPVYSQQS